MVLLPVFNVFAAASGGASAWLDTLKTIVAWIITEIMTVVNGLIATDGFLLPLFLFGIGISFVMVVFKIIRKITWGS